MPHDLNAHCMNVLNVCKDDWANFSHDNARALRSVGVDCKDVKLNPHGFKYHGESFLLDHAAIYDAIRESDVVQIFHSDITFLKYCHDNNKKIIVYHTGSTYRDKPDHYNAMFNPVVEKSVIALGEFASLGCKNEVYVVGAIDTAQEPRIETTRPYIIAHYPSNPKVKGSEKIRELMFGLDGSKQIARFDYCETRTDFARQRDRMSKCDIYIELFQKELGGKKYGSWGITALEAAALGKIVVTMNLSNEVYKKAYGDCALLLVEDELQFYEVMIRLMYSDEDYITILKKKTRQWVVDKHSLEATGKYLLKNVLGGI